MIDLRVVAAGAALVAAFGAGVVVQGWRGGAEIDRLRAQHSGAVATANRTALVLQRRLDDERNAAAERLAQIDSTGTAKLREAQYETNRLQRCIADGTCGLRVRTVERACSAGDVSGAATPGRVDARAGTELAPDARSAYFDLRAGLNRMQAKLAACQDSLDTLTQIKR